MRKQAEGSHWLEGAILSAGLLLCLSSLGWFALFLRTTTPAETVAWLSRTRLWGEAIVIPLGFLTAALCIAGNLRMWNLSARRSRLRLLVVALLTAIFLMELTAITPVVERLLAATDPNGAAVAADVVRLHRVSVLRAAMVLAVAFGLIAAHRSPMPVAAEVSADGLTTRHRTVLFLVGTATLFEGYDRFIATLALPYIGKDLGASEGALGYALAFIRIGALISVVLGRLADRHGRRRLLIISVVAYTLATAATGFSSALFDFAIFQLIAAIFLTTELTLAQVVIAEEFPPAARGFGQGVLGAFGALGAGLAAALFPVLQRTSYGWRGMYFIGVLPLLVVAYLQRNLPETQRWAQARHEDRSRLRELWRPRRRIHLLVLTLISGGIVATTAPAFSFASYRATTVLGWAPAQVSTMILGGGALGFCGYFVLGRLADAIGRRMIGCLGILGTAAAVASFYQTRWLLLSFALLTLSESGVLIAVNSLGTELFPTRLRATAKAWLNYSATMGALIGFVAVGAFSNVGGHSTVITALAALLLLLAPLLFLLVETRHKDLAELETAA